MHRLAVAFLRAAVLAAATSMLAAPARSEVLGCLIRPSSVVELGSPVIGVIQRLHVERGDTVRPQQVLVTMRDEVERASVGLAVSRASADAELAASDKALETARRKLERTQELFRQGFVSAQAVDAAEGRRAQAAEQRQHADRELQLAKAQLGTRTIRSPIDGVVVDVFRQAGERVEDKPMLKVATIDPLHVELVLPAADFGKLKAGDTVRVQPMLDGLPPATAIVRVVDRLIDPSSSTLRARLVLPNPGQSIPAGVRCQAKLPFEAVAGPSGGPQAVPAGVLAARRD